MASRQHWIDHFLESQKGKLNALTLISAESVVHVNHPNIQSRYKKVESRKKQKLISRAREANGIEFNIAKRTLIPPYSFFNDPILFFFYSTNNQS